MDELDAQAESVISRQWAGDQIWSHFNEEGEQWLLIRVASPRNERISQSPLLRKPARLLGNVAFSLKFASTP